MIMIIKEAGKVGCHVFHLYVGPLQLLQLTEIESICMNLQKKLLLARVYPHK